MAKLSHVVAMPYPGRGHINPMMNLCKMLVSREPDLVVSFVVTQEWLGLIGSDPKPRNIRFVAMPNVIPSEKIRGSKVGEFFEAVSTEMEAPFEHILDRLQPPPTSIIADTCLIWGIRVGIRKGIPVASFFPMSALTFLAFLHADDILKKGDYPVDLSGREDEMVDYVPGLSTLRLKELPRTFKGDMPKVFNIFREAFSWLAQAQCLLMSTVYELEPQVMDSLKPSFQQPIYTVGPVIPSPPSLSGEEEEEDEDLVEWLNTKPAKSVLFISLGSYLPVEGEQMDQVAAGLEESGVPFLWVARGGETSRRLGEGSCGKMVSWCNQVGVLCHPSIGGFLSHCGWNSIKEGIRGGVPILAFPLGAEQFTNAKLIVDDWRIGYRVVVVKKEEVSVLVKKLMDSGSSEGKEMRGRVRRLQKLCHGAVGEGGSTTCNVDAFLTHVSMSAFLHPQKSTDELAH